MTRDPTDGMMISILILGTRLTKNVKPWDYFEMDDCVVIRHTEFVPSVYSVFMMDKDGDVWSASHVPADAEAERACCSDLMADISPVGRWEDAGGVPVSIGNAYKIMHADGTPHLSD